MSVFLVLLTVLSFAVNLKLEFHLRSVMILFFLGLCYNSGLPVLNDLFNENNYSIAIVQEAATFIICLNFIYFISRYVIIRLLNVTSNISLGSIRDLSTKHAMMATALVGVLCILSQLILCYGMSMQSISIWSATWSDGLNLPTWITFPAQTLFIGSSSLCLCLLLQKRKGWMLLVILTQVFTILLLGSRSLIIGIIFPFIIFAFQRKWKYWMPLSLLFFSSFPMLLLSLQMFRWATGSSGILSFDSTEWYDMLSEQLANPFDTSELSLNKAFYDILTWNDSIPGFNEGVTYLRLLLLPIPSILIPDIKPPDFAWIVNQVYFGHQAFEGGSMHPTFYGDAFGNFAWLGILVGVFWALLISIIEKIVFQLPLYFRILSLAPLSTFCLLLARGSIYIAAIQIWQATLFFIALAIIVKFKFKKLDIITRVDYA